MLGSPTLRYQTDERSETSDIKTVLTGALSRRVRDQHMRIDAAVPHRTSCQGIPVGRLEGVQPPGQGVGIRGSDLLVPERLSAGERKSCRGPIMLVAPQPFPCESGPAKAEKRGIGRRVLPIGIMFASRAHPTSKVARDELAHSPGWGD